MIIGKLKSSAVYSKLEKQIDIKFRNKVLLEKVFIHRSYLNESDLDELESNERLEFLGDAVLELIVTEDLFQKFPDKAEGDLTVFRSALVKREYLAKQAKVLNLGEYLFLSKGEMLSAGQNKDYLLANTFEALVGAIYLDKGYKVVKKFIEKYIVSGIDEIIASNSHIDNKSRFQEKAQEFLSITPHYVLVTETGPDHDKKFIMGVNLGNEEIAQGKGSSKRKAEEEAAQKAMQIKGWE